MRDFEAETGSIQDRLQQVNDNCNKMCPKRPFLVSVAQVRVRDVHFHRLLPLQSVSPEFYLKRSERVSLYTVSKHLILCYLVLSYLILSYLILSCLVLSYLILSYLVLSCLVLSYLILSYLIIIFLTYVLYDALKLFKSFDVFRCRASRAMAAIAFLRPLRHALTATEALLSSPFSEQV